MAGPLDRKLWTPRSVEETQDLYADWAEGYDRDMARLSYATPDRIAEALRAAMPDPGAPVLDFGCGTGLSGMALRAAGVAAVDGTDISPQMLEIAQAKDVYRTLWVGTPGVVDAQPGDYAAIVATGVVSLGAAPPDMLAVLLRALAPGDLLTFSFNDPTLADSRYTEALATVLAEGLAAQVFREHGPHLSEEVTGSDVIVLRRA